MSKESESTLSGTSGAMKAWKEYIRDKEWLQADYEEYSLDQVQEAFEAGQKAYKNSNELSPEEQKEAEEILLAFECIGLCGKCWRRLLDLENKPKIAERLYNFIHGKYHNHYAATKRLEKYFKDPKYEDETIALKGDQK